MLEPKFRQASASPYCAEAGRASPKGLPGRLTRTAPARGSLSTGQSPPNSGRRSPSGQDQLDDFRTRILGKYYGGRLTAPRPATKMSVVKLRPWVPVAMTKARTLGIATDKFCHQRRCAVECVVLAVAVVAVGWLADSQPLGSRQAECLSQRSDASAADGPGRPQCQHKTGGQLTPGRERFERPGNAGRQRSGLRRIAAQRPLRGPGWGPIVGPWIAPWRSESTPTASSPSIAGDVAQQPWTPGGAAHGSRPGCACRWRAPRSSAWRCSFSAGRSGMRWSIGAMPGWSAPPRRSSSAGSRSSSMPWRRRLPWAGTVGTARAQNVNEKLIQETANALVSGGIRDSGYVYVSLDDGWQGEPPATTRGLRSGTSSGFLTA